MEFKFAVPTEHEPKEFLLNAGESLIFVGANGGGKTRLAVLIEERLGENSHRISAHRALTLNPEVAKINEEQALRGLRFGHPDKQFDIGQRQLRRWQRKAAVHLLNDFDYLIQALFADQSNTALRSHNKAREGEDIRKNLQLTKFNQLVEIWTELLPHRKLHVSGDDIKVSHPDAANKYAASDMSDGERAIFYMIGQVLVAKPNSLIIIDEPELHVHRSIMSKLWDQLEAIRPDCAFVFITHDLEFAAARNAQKSVIRSYDPAPKWSIEDVPDDTGFSDELATLILGSRPPILFVEGNEASLDIAIYRCCYPEWTVVPRGSCLEVIHSVVTMRNNAELTRITCSGLIDCDGMDDENQEHLARLGIMTLPVTEIENVFLLPDVCRAICAHEGFEGDEINERLEGLIDDVLAHLDSDEEIEAVVVRSCKRHIDQKLKRLDLSDAETATDIAAELKEKVEMLDIKVFADGVRQKLKDAIAKRDLPNLLKLYDNKGMLSHAAKRLRNNKKDDFESWLTRAMSNNKIAPDVTATVSEVLPDIQPM